MMRLVKILLALVVLLVIAVIALPFLIPTDTITSQVVATVKEKTGRELKLGSQPSLSFFPRLAFEAQNVSLSDPGGFERGALISMDEIKVDLELMPLLSGEYNIDKFILVKPVIDLKVAEDGSVNWDVSGPQQASGENAAPATDPSSGGGSGLANLRLGQIEISDGRIHYSNATDGTKDALENVNLSVALKDIASPFEAKGSAVWNGENSDLTVRVGSPKALMDGQATEFAISLESKHVKTSFDGTLTPENGGGLTGQIETSTPSIRALAEWARRPMAPGNGLGPFSVKSKINFADATATLSDAEISLDGMNARGNAVVAFAGERPNIRGSLGVDRIDINKYLGGGAGGSGGGTSSGSGGTGGWSDAPIDFSGLRAIDAQLQLSASQILFQKIKIGKSGLAVNIAGGVLSAKLTELALYGGQATGALKLDGSKKTQSVAASASIGGVQAHPFLTDAIGLTWLEGAGKLTFNVAASGASQRQLVSTLGGKAAVVFSDGAIRGINIAQMVRTLGTSIITGWQGGAAQKTDFSSFSASFDIKNGVASNSDLQLVGPLVRLTGAGSINMPKQSLAYKVRPKLVASLEGQGGETDLAGLDIPIKIDGSWSNPRIYPDIAGILENPEAAFKQLKGLGKGVGGGVKDAIKDGNPEKVLKELTKPKKDGDDPIGGVLKKLF